MLGYGKPVGYICRVIGGPGSNKYTTSGTSPRTQRSFYNVSEAPKTIIFLVNRHCISSSVFFYPLETKMATHGTTMVTSVLANLILITLADSLTNSALGVLIDPPWPLIPGFWNIGSSLRASSRYALELLRASIPSNEQLTNPEFDCCTLSSYYKHLGRRYRLVFTCFFGQVRSRMTSLVGSFCWLLRLEVQVLWLV